MKCQEILEHRYLVEKCFYQEKELSVWRVYDQLLGIVCFFLFSTENNPEKLEQISRVLDGAEEIQILAVKKIKESYVLIFSMQNREPDEERFLQILSGREKEQEAYISEVKYTEPPKEQEKILGKGHILDDRYRVIGCIGIGGFGITYLAEDLLLHRNVTIKEYFPAEWAEREESYVVVKSSAVVEAYRYGLQSFLREIRMTAAFIHVPRIVTVYDAFHANDTAYLVMEYIRGKSIGRHMKERGYRPYKQEDMTEIICPVLQALTEIHIRRIVHSDISPGNIMRTENGQIRLIDLGAAKYMSDKQPALAAAFLKVDYAAPEQYRTAREGVPRDEGPWTDVYAAGATMYYLLTGHKPTDVISRLNGVKKDLVPPRKYKVRISRKWMKLIRHAMALERTERIQTAKELLDEIEKIQK